MKKTGVLAKRTKIGMCGEKNAFCKVKETIAFDEHANGLARGTGRSIIAAVDLFCGAGGLTCGLKRAGIKVRAGVDIDPLCRYPYEKNNKVNFIETSVADIQAKDIECYFEDGEISLLAGCAPCQTFSKYNQKATSEDTRWWLLSHFGRLVKTVKPDLVTMENVPGLQRKSVFADFLATLRDDGYHVAVQDIRCEEYGMPQRRTRLVLLASRFREIALLTPSQFNRKPRTVRDTISHLPCLSAGEADKSDSMHTCAGLSPLNLRRIVASKPGGSWRDWPMDLICRCHRKATGKTYPSVYGRMKWDAPAPTITTQFFGFGNGRFGHPEQDRALSLREGALIQGFPESYVFLPPHLDIPISSVGRLIGNAVPVTLGEVIGESITHHCRQHSPRT